MTENEKKIFDFIFKDPIIYASIRLETELEELSLFEIEKGLLDEIKTYKKFPKLLEEYYPTPNHFLDYYIEVYKRIDGYLPVVTSNQVSL